MRFFKASTFILAAFAARCSKAGLKVAGRTVTLPAALGGAWLLESRAKEESS